MSSSEKNPGETRIQAAPGRSSDEKPARGRSGGSGITTIQAKLDQRFDEETSALFTARLRTVARLFGLLLLLLAPMHWIGGLVEGDNGAAVELVVLQALVGVSGLFLPALGPLRSARPRLLDVVLFAIPAAFLLAAQGITGGVDSPWYALYLLLVVARAGLVPGPRREHLSTLGVLVVAYPLALFLAGDTPLRVPPAAVQTLWLALAAGVGLLGSDMTHAMHERLVSARSMGRYKLQKELGRGAMGVVYLAWHRDLGRPCVIKFVHPEKDSSGALRHRFEREARETSLLRSPYTVQVFDFGVTPKGELYYVMEYLEGESLQDRLGKGGAQPFDLVCRWLSFACESLAEAHARGLIHRDVKPANLYLARTADGREAVKVLDFGIARKEPTEKPEIILSNSSVAAIPSEAELTAVGTVMGTPLYVAPEVLRGRPATPQADLYSLAATGFHLLTGRPVFTGKSIEELLRRTIKEPAPTPSDYVTSGVFPDALDRIFARALSKDPEQRHSSMESFRRALEPFAAAAGATHSTLDRGES